MKKNTEVVIASLLVLCALITTGLVIRRELFRQNVAAAQGHQKPVFVDSWREALESGNRLGNLSTSVTLIEFSDFECPYCAQFHKTLNAIRLRYPSQVGITYIHFPLPMHRFAIPAGRIAECAAQQGRFEAMHDQLFEHQDTFGLKPWTEYARAAEVPDIPQFDACAKGTDLVPSIEAGKRLGEKWDVRATPTLVVNGWKLGQPPSADELEKMIARILAGEQPVPAG